MTKKVLVPGSLTAVKDDVIAALEARGYKPTFMGKIMEGDIDIGQAYVDNDVCVATIGVIGQCVRYIRNKPGQWLVLVCEVCKDCRSSCIGALLPDALRRADIEGVEMLPFSCAELSSAIGSKSAEVAHGDKPLIGVCGNAVVMSTPLFNHTVIDHLIESGCDVAVPPLNLIVNEQDFLAPAMEWFDAQGVTSVICVLAFGCLGGHAYARGKARVLQELHPGVELTLLDYDPSASDINVINRTELVIQSAKERAGAAAAEGTKRIFG